MKADANAINRIINNLVENAIKFSNADGNINIILKRENKKVFFRVEDTGIGICPVFQKEYSSTYYQINNEKTNSQGMGLGLPIVKTVVEGLGGEIKIDSNPSAKPGISITVELAYHHQEESNVILSKYRKCTPPLILASETIVIVDTPYSEEKKSILLVEDNKSMLNFLFKKLSDKYNIFCSLNGADALKKIGRIASYS